MPIYEFRCAACENEFETMASISKVAETTCPSCGAGNPRRLMSVIAGMAGRASMGNMEKAASLAPNCGSGGCAACS